MENCKKELELYKRSYFATNPSSTKEEETQAVIRKAEEMIQNKLPTILSQNHATNQKARLLSEAGKLYNVLWDYNETAEKFLSKSVRLNPKSAETWHELGVCVMKREDFEFAQSCFNIALGISRTAPILTSLAISMRIVALSHPEPAQTEMRTKAMELIIEARRLDPSHGPANTAFATGLFYCFFSTAKVELQFLDKVVENYRRAIRECELSRTDVQVYINMATCLKFMEKFDETLDALQKSVEFDARNELETQEKLENFIRFLTKFADGIEKKGKMKTKRMMEMVEELRKTTSGDGKDAFRVKIIGNIGHQETIPVALVGVDVNGEVYGITIYNCLSNFGFVIGDTVTIAKPDFREIKNFQIPATPSIHVECLKWCRVATPTQIKKNGVALTDSVVARAFTTTQTK